MVNWSEQAQAEYRQMIETTSQTWAGVVGAGRGCQLCQVEATGASEAAARIEAHLNRYNPLGCAAWVNGGRRVRLAV